MADTALDYFRRLATKEQVTDRELAMYRPVRHGRYEIVVGDQVFPLDRQDEDDHLDAEEKKMARDLASTEAPFWDYDNNAAVGEGARPEMVDYRSRQTDIRHQKNRGTCVCFASLAGIEALLRAEQGLTVDLSEQYANWLFMRSLGRNHCDDGLRTTLSARYLSESGVCEEGDDPYEDLPDVLKHCDAQPAAQARANARYGIGFFTLVDRLGLFGPSISNPDYLEAIIAGGHEIVFGTHVAWFTPDENDIFDVKLDSFGNPAQSNGGHAMLIVGYDRRGPKPYFIIKNSWGIDVGHDGYWFLSYDYVRTYAKYGYFINSVRTDMPINA